MLIGGLFASAAQASRIPLSGLSVLQGYTDATSTQFTVLVPKGKPARYFVRSERMGHNLELHDVAVQHFEREYSDWAVDQIKVNGLNLKKSYSLEIRSAYGELIDVREFRALDIKKPKTRFVAASCMDQNLIKEQRSMWAAVFQNKPELIFLLGDNVYATINKPKMGPVTPKILWSSYVQSRINLDLYHAPKLVPTLAIWDDADYGEPDGDRDYKYRKDSSEIFHIFYPQEPDYLNFFSGPGTAHFFLGFQMNFALMDARFFRSPKGEREDTTHWGTAQERWLLVKMREYPRPTWILNGDQIFGGYHSFESYEGQRPASLNSYLPQLGALPNPVIFLTGDRHLTEIMKIEEPNLNLNTFEITTSPLHAPTYPSPWKKTPNRRQIAGQAGALNFALIEAMNTNGNLNVAVALKTINNKTLFLRKMSVKKSPVLRAKTRKRPAKSLSRPTRKKK